MSYSWFYSWLFIATNHLCILIYLNIFNDTENSLLNTSCFETNTSLGETLKFHLRTNVTFNFPINSARSNVARLTRIANTTRVAAPLTPNDRLIKGYQADFQLNDEIRANRFRIGSAFQRWTALNKIVLFRFKTFLMQVSKRLPIVNILWQFLIFLLPQIRQRLEYRRSNGNCRCLMCTRPRTHSSTKFPSVDNCEIFTRSNER